MVTKCFVEEAFPTARAVTTLYGIFGDPTTALYMTLEYDVEAERGDGVGVDHLPYEVLSKVM